MPRFSAVFRLEQCGILHLVVNVIGIVKRRFQMPDTLEFPRMLRAIVPLVGRQRLPSLRRGIVNELVTRTLLHAVRALQFLRTAARCGPGFTSVSRPLNNLSIPTNGLRCVEAVG